MGKTAKRPITHRRHLITKVIPFQARSLFLKIDPIPPIVAEPQKKWYETFEGWKSRVEFTAIFFAIGYALITYLQWHDSNSNFIKEERPYILSTDATLASVAYGKLFSKVTYSNFGKSPALHVKVLSDLLVGNGSYESWFREIGEGDIEKSDAALAAHAPGQHLSEEIIAPAAPAGSVVGNRGEGGPPDSQYAIVLRIQYQDISGKFYWADVCWEHAAGDPDTIIRCPTRND